MCVCESIDKIVHNIIIITFITALDICLELLTSKNIKIHRIKFQICLIFDIFLSKLDDMII